MSFKLGLHFEAVGRAFLEGKGFKIIESNYYTRYGEIDIIAMKDDVLHFIEVKYSKSDPYRKFSKAKMSRVIKSALLYLQDKELDNNFCIDALAIHNEKINLYENLSFGGSYH
ncbi:hypothetical protein BKH43_03790 [Helicobacter sp. 13S00401-1]|uniref:YraN family protein n=1 Tax=Helicobacter sp. 13S00401-1 TaxID=1905758 RepID=UPI000BA560A9|nr:YraN family protein [Helicobacter sp. 13S00401-1]PAF50987.1 hypothetical protein BKH43_03790 [Helicobacter sp. 13S00401-1]